MAPATMASTAVTMCAKTFVLAPAAGIYGLGQYQRGIWNYSAGGAVQLGQANTDVSFYYNCRAVSLSGPK